MKNIKLILEYDGTRYQGWQRPGRKTNPATVSGRLINTLSNITQEEITLFCAARTEPGVHASCQTVNFKTSTALSPAELRRALNRYLPRDIAVLSAEEVPERFHSALNLRSLTYTCRIQTGQIPDIFTQKYSYHLPAPLNTSAMNTAASTLLGTHDFRYFSSAKTKKTSEKTLQAFRIQSVNEQELQITLKGTAFLYQMPGLLIGTLLEIGQNLRSPDSVRAVLAGEEMPAQPVPPYALILTETLY